eukprot:919241-Alexandrium_andersonii.AAC.1
MHGAEVQAVLLVAREATQRLARNLRRPFARLPGKLAEREEDSTSAACWAAVRPRGVGLVHHAKMPDRGHLVACVRGAREVHLAVALGGPLRLCLVLKVHGVGRRASSTEASSCIAAACTVTSSNSSSLS